MTIFRHEDEPPRHSKRCKFLTTTLKDAFSSCHIFSARPRSVSGPEEDCATSDFENDQEEEVVSEIRARAMEKQKRKSSFLSADSFSTLLFSPSTGELYMTPQKRVTKEEDIEGEELCSAVTSCFSVCPSKEGFVSAKTEFSRCSSFNRLESEDLWQFNISDVLPDFRRRSIILEFSHCEGWPFGLCRKIFLLPPLPKSPSDSWTWRKGSGLSRVITLK